MYTTKQENDYFVPALEDIRVGYECEMTLPTKDWWTHDTWTKCVLEDKACTWNSEISELDGAIDKIPLNQIRVPYLTKEQIEREDWTVETDEGNGVIDFKKDQYKYLSWNYVLKTIEINNGVTTTRFGNHLFRGECKDINTFRYICKLLRL